MPISKNCKLGTPLGPHQQQQKKTEKNSVFSFKLSTSSSAAINIPALNDFLLFPQTVPSRISTGFFGPISPQTFSLLLGQANLISKRITIHPEITDSNYKRKIQIMMSSQIL